jgi:hypothetical protein
MKSAKAFFLLMIVLIICLLFFNWVKNTYYPNQAVSPIARIRTIFVFIAGIIIMKLSTTNSGFKIFIIAYLILWGIFYGLIFITNHKIGVKSDEMLDFYKDLIPLETPLPLIFFWFVDKLFFGDKSVFKKSEA